MRGVLKGAPPPNNVRKPGDVAATLAQADAAYQAGLPVAPMPTVYARAEFNRLKKSVLRANLFLEQRCLCVFCERQVAEPPRPLPPGVEPPPIDHWEPLSLYLHRVFDWSNLHISCQTIDTCDDRKKSLDLGLPVPSTFRFEDVFGFTSGGRVYVRNDVVLAGPLRAALELALDDCPGPGGTVPSTLNLNQPALRAAREAAIEDEERALGATPPGAAGADRAGTLLGQAQRLAFVSARVAYLLNHLGRGR